MLGTGPGGSAPGPNLGEKALRALQGRCRGRGRKRGALGVAPHWLAAVACGSSEPRLAGRRPIEPAGSASWKGATRCIALGAGANSSTPGPCGCWADAPGTGKTDCCWSWRRPRRSAWWISRALAHHRGGSFGGLGLAPHSRGSRTLRKSPGRPGSLGPRAAGPIWLEGRECSGGSLAGPAGSGGWPGAPGGWSCAAPSTSACRRLVRW